MIIPFHQSKTKNMNIMNFHYFQTPSTFLTITHKMLYTKELTYKTFRLQMLPIFRMSQVLAIYMKTIELLCNWITSGVIILWF